MYKNIFIKIFKIIFKIIWEYFCVHFSRWRFGIFPFLTGTKNIWSCLFGLVCAVGLFWFPHVVRNLICANAGHYFFKWRSLFFNFWVGRQKAYKHKCFFVFCDWHQRLSQQAFHSRRYSDSSSEALSYRRDALLMIFNKNIYTIKIRLC